MVRSLLRREDPAVLFVAIFAAGHFIAVDVGFNAKPEADDTDLSGAVLVGVDRGIAIDPNVVAGGLVKDPGRDVADLTDSQVADNGWVLSEPPQTAETEDDEDCD
ncbi:MAG: hypothetical protein ACREGR_00370 [Minisyncoccia bacterium]